MAAGTKSDFVIYHEEFFGGWTETAMQNADVFNAASRGTIRLVPQRAKGDYEKESFMKEISSLITRRDVASVSAATDLKMEQGEGVAVKINRKIGPAANTRDSFKKIAADPSKFSFLLGQQWGAATLVDMVNSAIRAATAALSGQTAVKVDYSATGTILHSYLAEALAKFGDNAKSIICWCMHSKQYYDLVKQAMTDKITNIADVAIVEGTTPTLGRPTIITDDSSLIVSGTPNKYICLGLVGNGAVVTESEDRDVESQVITGYENLLIRVQGEYAYNLRVKGFTWDVTNGGANPTNAAVATATNWDKVAADNKSLAGVYLLTQ
jgi:hypothetical protein